MSYEMLQSKRINRKLSDGAIDDDDKDGIRLITRDSICFVKFPPTISQLNSTQPVFGRLDDSYLGFSENRGPQI